MATDTTQVQTPDQIAASNLPIAPQAAPQYSSEDAVTGVVGDYLKGIRARLAPPIQKAVQTVESNPVGRAAIGAVSALAGVPLMQELAKTPQVKQIGQEISSTVTDPAKRNAFIQGIPQTGELGEIGGPFEDAAKELLQNIRWKKAPELKGDPFEHVSTKVPSEEGDTSFNFGANAPANEPEKTQYHPDLQKLVDHFGTSDDASKLTNGTSFITPDGKFVHLAGGTTHDSAIDWATGSQQIVGDNRPEFLKNTGVVRTRFNPRDKAGPTMHISVPEQGVEKEQIPAIQQAVAAAGKSGNLVLERADIAPETKDSLSVKKEFPRVSDTENYLRQIQSHPDQHWSVKAAQMAKEQGGGFSIDPRTGEAPKDGYMVEAHTEGRKVLDHPATAADIKDFHNKHKDLFDKHPELHVGGYNNELTVSAKVSDKDTAINLGKALDQKSIWDVKNGKEINTGGEGKRTEFPNYPLNERMSDVRGTAEMGPKGFENLPKRIHDSMEPDERRHIEGSKVNQKNITDAYHSITPSLEETANSINAGAMNAGWWQRFMDAFEKVGGKDEDTGVSHGEILKQWHSALSGNKSVQDAANLAGHSYADWLDAGKPTDRKSIDDIIRKNGMQPKGSSKKGNAAMSDTLDKDGSVLSKGIDTTKIWQLANSPEIRGEKPFTGDVFGGSKNPLRGGKGYNKIPSMGATTAGVGNLNRLVLDSHVQDFYGENNWSDNTYIAHSVHLRHAAEALGLKGGEGQEQQWGAILGLKALLKEGMSPAEAASNITDQYILKMGKDYAEIIKNDPESNDIWEKLKKHGINSGTDINKGLDEVIAGRPKPREETGVDQTLLENTARRIRETISPSKIKTPKTTPDEKAAGWIKMMQYKPKLAEGLANKPDGPKDREELHNSIVNKYISGRQSPTDRPPTATILGGGTGSGKTTLAKSFPDYENSLKINSDMVKEHLPEYNALKKSDPENAAAKVHEESSRISKKILANAIGNKLDFTLDSTSSKEGTIPLIKHLIEQGHKVNVLFSDVPIETAIERSEHRALTSSNSEDRGRFIPDSQIKESNVNSAKNFFKIVGMTEAPDVSLYDNSGASHKLVYQRIGGKETILDPVKYEKYKQKAGIDAAGGMARGFAEGLAKK